MRLPASIPYLLQIWEADFGYYVIICLIKMSAWHAMYLLYMVLMKQVA